VLFEGMGDCWFDVVFLVWFGLFGFWLGFLF
jgi:hypothetical protein